MKRWQWWAAGICAYVLILVVIAPASVLDSIAQHASGGRLRIAAAQGTLWSGRGELQVVDVRREAAVGKRIAWKISPASLIAGRLVCAITTDDSARSFALTATPSRIEISNAELSVPAALLGIAEPKLVPLALGGTFDMRIAHINLARTELSATAIVIWRGAMTEHSTISPLGDYELTLAPAADGIAMHLRTIDGALHLDGGGLWARGGKASFKATARAAPEYRQALEPFLRLIAYDRGGGNYELQLQ